MGEQLRNLTVEQLCRVIDMAPDTMDGYMFVFDIQNDYYYISKCAMQRFRITTNGFHNVVDNLATFVYPEDMEMLQADIKELLAMNKEAHDLEYRWISKEGKPVWVNCRGQVFHDEQGTPLYMFGCINEMGIAQKADNLSGLLKDPSVRAFFESYGLAEPDGYLMRIGVDDLRGINARLGVEYGDLVLQKTAQCISEVMLPEQKVYRVVGDEFLVLDYQGGTQEEAEALFGRIRQNIEDYMQAHQYEVVFSVSAGILMSKDIGEYTYSNIMKLSEFALNEAKQQGRNTYTVFQQESYARYVRRRELMIQLRRAVNSNFEGFQAYFQPIFGSDQRISGAETLMRFSCEEMGRVSPAEFIPVLEESGLIIPAGRWIMHQALAACKQFQRYIPNFRITFNVSYVQVMKIDIAKEIINAVREYDLTPGTVVVELTESGFLESDYRFSRAWTNMKDNGIKLALDDFGTGYANFHYLNELRPNIVKVDRSFTVSAMHDEMEFTLLTHLRSMSESLGLDFCIEGIETEAELEKMSKLIAGYYQGFHFGRPCPCEQFMDDFLLKAGA